MATLEFQANRLPTVGIEIELGLLDVQTMALSNSFARLAERLPDQTGKHFKPEIIQSVLEINTDVCESIKEADKELRGRLGVVEAAADELGLMLWWGGLHPFALCRDQLITDDERYHMLVDQLQLLARRMLTFGLHVHVGVDSGDKAVMICDRILRHLPTLLALSSNSPYWEGQATGLQSYRSKVMEMLPTAGLPPLMRNWSEYVWLVNQMTSTGYIKTIREIWWDVRPHHNFGTVEIRMCDMPGNLDDTLALAALIHCLVKALSDEIDEGAYQHDCHPMMVRQNKWRAARYGLAAQLVDAFNYEVRAVPEIVDRLVDRLQSTADDLGCRDYLDHCRSLAAGPSWADRQMQLAEETGSLPETVRRLAREARISPTEPPQATVRPAAVEFAPGAPATSTPAI
ncbi:MAG: YbdK family carboxylate-amine ligase [Pirellulales bacterium]|nr:YbdK family carboxylate-amine ligase [Pirellulales bacterium]